MSQISLLFSRKASSFLEVGTGMCRPTTTVAPFHSNSCSSGRSMFDKITNRDDALKLLDEMTAWQPLPSVDRFTRLLQAVTNLRHYSCAVEFFQRMNSLGVPINAHTTRIVIQCLCQMHCTREGFAVLGYGYKRAVVPDVFILSKLLDGLIHENKVSEAERFFRKLVKDKVWQPNAVMYTHMIKGLCKIGDTDAAIALLRDLQREMRERDHTTVVVHKTNAVAYGAIIAGLCKKRKVDEALKMFRELVFHERVDPYAATYTSLLHGLGGLSRRGDISNLLIELEANGLLDYETQRIFFNVYCKLGWMEEAEGVVKLMPCPGVEIYKPLICGYCSIGNMRKARQYMDLLRSKSISIDLYTYNELMKALFEDCMLGEEPFSLLDEMIEQGREPTLVTYHIMLEGFFKRGFRAQGRRLFNWMLEHSPDDHRPNELTYMIVLRGLCDNKQVDEALCVYHSMGDHKLNSNIRVYDLLIDAASKSGKLDAARNLFYDLTIKGLQPKPMTYAAMIHGYFREGHVEQARRLFLEMKVAGVMPDSVTPGKQLLEEFRKNKQLDIAEILIQEMKGRGVDLITNQGQRWVAF